MPEVYLTTNGAAAVNRQDLNKENGLPPERDKLVGKALRDGFKGDVVGELAARNIAQQSEVNGRTLTFMTGLDAEGSRQAAESGQQSSIENVLDRVGRPDIDKGLSPAESAVSRGVVGYVHASSGDSVKGQQLASYQAVKAAGNGLVPHLKKDYRRSHDAKFSRDGKASVGDTVRSVSSTADRLEPDSVGTVLDHAVLSKLAYKGVGRSEQKFPVPAGFECASPDDLPAALRPCYDSQTGLLEMPSKGAKALVVKNADTVVVAFAGTQPKAPREHSMTSDLVQRCGFFDPMYRDAAGMVGMILDHPPNRGRTLHLTGHSLGGGLALFSNIANAPGKDAGGTANRESMKTYAFDPAGLSASYLAALGKERISRSADRLTSVRVRGDPFSYSGTGRTGRLVKGRSPGKTVTLTRPEKDVSPSAPKRSSTHSVDTAIEVVEHALPAGGGHSPDRVQ